MKKYSVLLLVTLFAVASCHKDHYVIKKHTYKVYDKGINGNTSADLVLRVDTAVIALKPNLVIIMAGTNDVSQDVPFGTYKANMTTLITKLKAVNSQIILLSPPPRGRDTISPTDVLNNNTDTIATILSQLSKTYGCYYFNMNAAFKNAGSPNPTASSLILNEANYPQMPDGLHVTEQGLTFMATKVFNFMQANNLLNYYNIVCFGDSITLEGETMSYPSQLQALLNNN